MEQSPPQLFASIFKFDPSTGKTKFFDRKPADRFIDSLCFKNSQEMSVRNHSIWRDLQPSAVMPLQLPAFGRW